MIWIGGTRLRKWAPFYSMPFIYKLNMLNSLALPYGCLHSGGANYSPESVRRRLSVSCRLLIFNCLFILQNFGVFVWCSQANRLFCLPFENTFHFDTWSQFFRTHTHGMSPRRHMERRKRTARVSAFRVMQCDTLATLTCNCNSVFPQWRKFTEKFTI